MNGFLKAKMFPFLLSFLCWFNWILSNKVVRFLFFYLFLSVLYLNSFSSQHLKILLRGINVFFFIILLESLTLL